MTVAENKIVELKLSLDRTQADKDNLSGQYTQAKAQVDTLKQENYTLKDYINKMSQYYQQYQQQLTSATQSIRQNS
jgi:uncharacterized coiled-coil DUF342 family protein